VVSTGEERYRIAGRGATTSQNRWQKSNWRLRHRKLSETHPSGFPRWAREDEEESRCGNPDVDKGCLRSYRLAQPHSVGRGRLGKSKEPTKPVAHPGWTSSGRGVRLSPVSTNPNSLALGLWTQNGLLFVLFKDEALYKTGLYTHSQDAIN